MGRGVCVLQESFAVGKCTMSSSLQMITTDIIIGSHRNKLGLPIFIKAQINEGVLDAVWNIASHLKPFKMGLQ